jgi:hypothetical protein
MRSKPVFVSWLSIATLSLGTGCDNSTSSSADNPDATASADGGTVSYAVDIALFKTEAMGLTVTDGPCTLSDGTETACWFITSPTGFPYGTPTADRPYCQGGYGYGDVMQFTTAESLYDCTGIGGPGSGGGGAASFQCFNCAAKETTSTFAIPKVPVPQAEPVDLAEAEAASVGYGVALDGVLLSEPTPTKSTTPPYPAVDPCGGHATPPGSYHYHFIPAVADRYSAPIECLVDGGDPLGDGHSAMFGYALDGYPMHGRFGDDGKVPADLDACRGHTHATKEFPGGVYHYHAEHLVDASQAGLPDTGRFYTFNGCFKGAVGYSTLGGDGGGGGGTGGMGTGDPAPCPEGQTSRCCGDGTCDGPETATNCAADCT